MRKNGANSAWRAEEAPEKRYEIATVPADEDFPLVVYFTGSRLDKERVLSEDHGLTVSLGVCVHALQIGLPFGGLPRAFWPQPPPGPLWIDRILREWPRRVGTGLFDMAELWRLDPYGRVVARPIKMRRMESVRGIMAWYCNDLEAAAWAEFWHALTIGAVARSCYVCGVRFLRSQNARAEKCPTCKLLNWRQRKLIPKTGNPSARIYRARSFVVNILRETMPSLTT